MAASRTAWHVLLAALLHERAPRRFEVRSEVPLSAEPLRADYLLLCTVGVADVDPPGPAPKRWKLWSLLPKDTLVELKSTGRPYRSRNLNRLWAYLHLYFADQPARLASSPDLAGVLLVAARTPSLDADAQALGLTWQDLRGGYWKLVGGPFTLYVGEIDVVAEAEDDDLLRLFGHAQQHTIEGRRWLSDKVGGKETAMEMHELEGYDEVILKLLTSLPPEQRLAGLAPEQRLAGLAPEQAVLVLSDDMLRALSDEYLAKLPAGARAAIRTRIGR